MDALNGHDSDQHYCDMGKSDEDMDDEEFDALMRDQGLEERTVTTIAFTHPVASADELWDGFLAGSLRMAVRITSQDQKMQRRIRAALDRVVDEYRRDGAIDLPVAAKLASGRKPTQTLNQPKGGLTL